MAEDLLRRYLHELHGLHAGSGYAAAFAFVGLIVGIAVRPAASRRTFAIAVPAFAVCVAVWAMLAWSQRWACDDAFISFRYARNWVEGHGLVYNPGERVEGYTNFLWTALVAVGLLLRVDPVVTTVALGYASALCALALAWKLSRDLGPARTPPLIAPAVVLLAGNRLFAQYTTSGLETMFAATLSLYALERAANGRRFAAGCAGVLATMAHPDHALAYAALFFALLLEAPVRQGRFAQRCHFIGPYLAPLLLLYLPYVVWKAHYYGSFVPNTYYAKSANAAYFPQGLAYIAISAVAAGFLGALPLICASLVVLRKSLLARYFALLCLGYLFYVAKIGGDFMLGRLFVLLLLPAAVLIDIGAQTLFSRAGRLGRGATLLGCAAAMSLVVHTSVIHLFEKYHHVADEQSFYPLNALAVDGVASDLTDMARDFKVALAHAHVRPTMVTGCVGIFGYLTGLRIIDVFGLTDAHVARQPLAERGRPGHEKWISLAYAVEGGGDFTEIKIWPDAYDKYLKFRVAGSQYYLLAHRPERIAGFARGWNVRLPRTEKLIMGYQGARKPEQVACDVWFFDTFYFRHHPGEELHAFVQRLVAKKHIDPALADFESVKPGQHPPGYTRVRSFELDAPGREGFRGTRGTLASWSVRQGPVGQAEVGNARGAFIDSFTPQQHDQSVGEVWSPDFMVTGDVIELYVAGGQRDDVEVALEVDGERVARATGCDLELLGRRLWNVAPYKGRRAVIRIRDQNKGGWGHVIVDRISEWRASPAGAPGAANQL